MYVRGIDISWKAVQLDLERRIAPPLVPHQVKPHGRDEDRTCTIDNIKEEYPGLYNLDIYH